MSANEFAGSARDFIGGVNESNFLGTFGPGSGHVFDNRLTVGSYINYNGTLYRWDGARWLDVGGIGANIQIGFSTDPFANAEPAEWGKPFPIWADGVKGGANPMAMAYHIQQRQLLQITAYMEMNTELEIPLIDADGNPLLDPAVPPCSYMRRDLGATDRVTDVPNGQWSDANTGLTGYAANNDSVAFNEKENPCFSHLFRIEKTPNPHWVLRISYVFNRLTTGGGTPITTYPATVLVSAFGNGCTETASQSVTVGTSGVFGHYRILRVYFSGAAGDQPPNSTAASEALCAQPILLHDQAQLVSNLVAVPIYFTDTGLSGGTSLLHGSYAPFVRPYGDLYFSTTPGATEQNWVASTLGIPFHADGLWPSHFDASTNALPIQNYDFDEYINISILSYGAGRWVLQLYSYLDSTDSAGYPIVIGAGPPPGPNRHVQVFTLGRIP